MKGTPKLPWRLRRLLPAFAVLTALLVAPSLAGCGDDESPSAGAPEPAAAAPEDSLGRAEELADCAAEAGFDPTISDGEEPGATAVDLTTETATIVLQVFESAADAAGYESAAGLDQEQVGSVVIIGGAIPPAQRREIHACIG